MTPEALLADLRDIHPPTPGGFWPPAPGWWLLALLLLLGCLAIIYMAWRRYQRTRWRQQALRELQALAARATASNHWFAELNSLLKRCARTAAEGQHPQALTGDAWAAYLTAAARPDQQQAPWALLVTAAWQPEPELPPEEAVTMAGAWIRGLSC
ncbi:MAG: DUF4381 domain-containing protein [Marinobacter sp.]|nr:DUF4381 domain-containing protein [Marinobacter sp.]